MARMADAAGERMPTGATERPVKRRGRGALRNLSISTRDRAEIDQTAVFPSVRPAVPDIAPIPIPFPLNHLRLRRPANETSAHSLHPTQCVRKFPNHTGHGDIRTLLYC